MSYIGRQPQIGNFQICDAISTVNNQAAYTMQVGSVNVLPETANHMIVSLNGVIQAPISSYTVSGSTITFAANLVTGDVINFIQILGDVLDLGVPSDGTVSTAKLATNAVTTVKITDANVTLAKLGADSVNATKIADGSIENEHLNVLAITGQSALTSVASDDTVLISDTSASGALKKMTRANFVAGIGGTNTPTWSATMGSNQSISNNTTTKLNFNTEQWDVGTGFNTSNYNYTVPSGGAGKYALTATVTLHNAASGNRVSCFIFKGGSALCLKNEYSSQTQDTQSTVSFSAILSAGDVLDVRASTDQGSPQFDAANSFFSGFKIIE